MARRKAKKSGERGHGPEVLGALADEAKQAADRAGAAVDDALAFVAASDARIARMEFEAQKKASEGWRLS